MVESKIRTNACKCGSSPQFFAKTHNPFLIVCKTPKGTTLDLKVGRFLFFCEKHLTNIKICVTLKMILHDRGGFVWLAKRN